MANQEAPPAQTRAGTTEQRTALRAKIILRAAEGIANVADELGISVRGDPPHANDFPKKC
jgi:hypothetical protein